MLAKAGITIVRITSADCRQRGTSTTAEAALDKHCSETATTHAVDNEVSSRVESDKHVTGSAEVTPIDHD